MEDTTEGALIITALVLGWITIVGCICKIGMMQREQEQEARVFLLRRDTSESIKLEV